MFWPLLIVLIAAKNDYILLILAAINYLYWRPKIALFIRFWPEIEIRCNN